MFQPLTGDFLVSGGAALFGQGIFDKIEMSGDGVTCGGAVASLCREPDPVGVVAANDAETRGF